MHLSSTRLRHRKRTYVAKFSLFRTASHRASLDKRQLLGTGQSTLSGYLSIRCCLAFHELGLHPQHRRLSLSLQGGGEEVQGQPGAVAAVLRGDELLPGGGGVAGLL